MEHHRIARSFCHLSPHPIGKEIGMGSDGIVFEICDEPQKVIKIGVIQIDTPNREYQRRTQILNFLVSTKPRIYARVYEHEKLEEQEDFIAYYAVMERLFDLSDDEKKVFHSVLSHEDRGIVKNLSPRKLDEMLGGLETGLEFSKENVMRFLMELRTSPIRHLDLHPRNIMRDILGNYRLVDFDRCTLIPQNA